MSLDLLSCRLPATTRRAARRACRTVDVWASAGALAGLGLGAASGAGLGLIAGLGPNPRCPFGHGICLEANGETLPRAPASVPGTAEPTYRR
jgi:hypothetical protein